jgi:hypothetical protein
MPFGQFYYDGDEEGIMMIKRAIFAATAICWTVCAHAQYVSPKLTIGHLHCRAPGASYDAVEYLREDSSGNNVFRITGFGGLSIPSATVYDTNLTSDQVVFRMKPDLMLGSAVFRLNIENGYKYAILFLDQPGQMQRNLELQCEGSIQGFKN